MLFYVIIIFMKIILLLLLLFIYFFHENHFYFFMFRDVPECSGMFHVPGFIDARLVQPRCDTGSLLDPSLSTTLAVLF